MDPIYCIRQRSWFYDRDATQTQRRQAMTTERRRAAMTAFETRDDADRALTDLRNAGYSDEHVGWAMRGEEAPEGTTDEVTRLRRMQRLVP